jgi:saccharopine dehydrogenase-like NADP-dependent oxidoreductase
MEEEHMKALVIGAAGKMGRAVVRHLVNDPDVSQVGLLDLDEEGVQFIAREDRTGKLMAHPLEVENKVELEGIMGGYDVGVATLPNRKVSYHVMETAVGAGMHLVDMLEEYHRRPDKYETEGFEIPADFEGYDEYGEWLHERAVDNDVLVLDGMGFAPGLSNISSAQGIRTLDKAQAVVARVGGIPNIDCCEKHPLRYMTTWSLEHVLREYSVRTQVLKDGEVVEVQALVDRERFRFEKFGIDVDLECAVTPGMPSFIYTFPGLEQFSEKTVRWPGHYDGVRTLIECGLFEEEPVTFGGTEISPREFLLKMINPRLVPQEGDGDVCVMYNTIVGEKDGALHKVEYFMWEEANAEFSAMARVTGFPAAIGAKMIAAGAFEMRGIRAPEECFTGANYRVLLEALQACDIQIAEEVHNLEAHAKTL